MYLGPIIGSLAHLPRLRLVPPLVIYPLSTRRACNNLYLLKAALEEFRTKQVHNMVLLQLVIAGMASILIVCYIYQGGSNAILFYLYDTATIRGTVQLEVRYN